ncbi:MAG: tetratricopeptide repeat protein, partial [Cyanobacteriota bacterium]
MQEYHVLLKSHRYREAIVVCDRILEIQPDCYQAWNNRGVALAKIGRHIEALYSYDRVLALEPNLSIGWNNRGCSLGELGRYDEAIRSYNQAIGILYKYYEAWHNLGNVYMILGRRWAAFFCYFQAWRFHPGWSKLGIAIRGLIYYSDITISTIGDYAIAVFNYCVAQLRKPNYREIWNQADIALRKFSRYSGIVIRGLIRYSDGAISRLGDYAMLTFSYCIKLIRKPNYQTAWNNLVNILRYRSDKALGIKPTNNEYWYNLGNIQKRIGCYNEAIYSYDIAVTINPTNYESHYNCGHALLQLGRNAEALQSFELALGIKPNNSAAQYSIEKALSNLETFKEEIERYNQALTCRANDYEVYYTRGNTLWNLGRYLEAIASFNQALKVAPSYLEDWYHRGRTLLNLKRYLEAIASFEHALRIHAGYHKAWYERGLALQQIARYEEAIDSFEQALAIDSSYGEAWYNRGLALLSIGRYKDAIDSFNQCLQLQPQNFNALNGRGLAWYKLGRYQEAIDSFNQSLQLESSSHKAWYNLGNALKDSGYYQEAIENFDKALQLKEELFWLAWNERGWAVFKLLGYKKALENWSTGLNKLHSNNVLLRTLLYYHFSETTSLILSLAIFLYRTKVNTLIEPEGCGVLYHSVARAHYQYGQQQRNHQLYWKKAKVSYKYALKYLTAEKFCQRRLEVLKGLIPLCRDLGEFKEVEALGIDGRDLLARLLKETPSIGKQSQLRLEFLDFDRLRVDQLAQSSKAEDRKAALELAEKHKNLCLRYCLYGWSDTDMDSLGYSDIQRLLNPDTALIYWHISPAAITTFILRFQKPLLIWKYSRVQNIGRHFILFLSNFIFNFVNKSKLKGFVYPPYTRQLHDFEAWIKEWKKQYQEYRGIENVDHIWRKYMQKRLNKLGRILNIPAISWELKNISQVILIPHRDLHLLPVSLAFPEHLTISYLPSAKVGIDLQQHRANSGRRFLTVENPRNDLSNANVESA